MTQRPNPPVDPLALDVPQLAALVGLCANRAILDTLHRSGFPGLRESHGFVFQHLLGGPRTISDVARRLGVTQQAASKTVGQMVRLGLLSHTRGPDARGSYVKMSAKGERCVTRGRALRARTQRSLERSVGTHNARVAHQVLWRALELVGGDAQVRTRQVRAPA